MLQSDEKIKIKYGVLVLMFLRFNTILSATFRTTFNGWWRKGE